MNPPSQKRSHSQNCRVSFFFSKNRFFGTGPNFFFLTRVGTHVINFHLKHSMWLPYASPENLGNFHQKAATAGTHMWELVHLSSRTSIGGLSLVGSFLTGTRWAPSRGPSSYRWSYNSYKWPYNGVTGVITLVIGAINQVISGSGGLGKGSRSPSLAP